MPFTLYADPIVRPDLWDVTYINGQPSPGIATVTTAGIDYQWDKKPGPGQIKRTTTFRGQNGSDVKIVYELWTPEQFKAWENYQGFFEYDSTKKEVKAINIIHPALVFLKITALVTEKIGAITHKGKGLYTVQIDMSEFAPPPKKNATKTPTAVSSRQGTTTVERVNIESENDRRLAQLRAKAAQP